jgi:hypothetical protein
MRVVVHGTGIEPRATPLVARLGHQPLLAFIPQPQLGLAIGYLAAVPVAGDELRIGYLGEELEPTGLTYRPPDA